MNFHDADFLYSISQEHIKYTSVVLKMNMSKLTRRFFGLYWPGFSCGLSVKDFVSSLIEPDYCSYRTLQIFFICFYIMKLKIRNLSLHQTKRIDLSGTVAQKRWTKIQFKDPLYPTYEPGDYFNNYRDFLFHTGTTVVAIAKKKTYILCQDCNCGFFP